MPIFKYNSWKDVLIHLLIIAVVGIGLLMFFFHVYLPAKTNHAETITVPDVRGVTLSELDEFLAIRDLRYEVTEDSGFSADKPPLSVLKQFPLPNSKVKENRKIYVSINAEKPPLVRMPKLVGGSVKNAQLVLKTYDLKLGDIRYVADFALNNVLEQRINGQTVSEGEKIPKGSTIDLVVGDGLGNTELESPNLIGLDAESAQMAIIGSGLKMGRLVQEENSTAIISVENPDGELVEMRKEVSPGAVVKQNPTPGEFMRLGQLVDIWIYAPDSLNTNPTLLDQ